jgi:hypothetical protein
MLASTRFSSGEDSGGDAVFYIAILDRLLQRRPGDGGRRTGAVTRWLAARSAAGRKSRRTQTDMTAKLWRDEDQIATGQVGGDGRWAAEGAELHGAGNQCLHRYRAAGVNDLGVETILFE